jgi:predicted AAA+ superfamily ATPase
MLSLPKFYKIFHKELNQETIDYLKDLKPGISHDQLMQAFLKGGYPEPVLENDEHFYDVWMENYLQTYIQRDIRTLFPRLDLAKYQRFISMLSGLTGTTINRSQVGRSLDISEKAIRDYLQIAEGSYVWRNIPSYEKSMSKSVVKMPKGCIRDSGLSNYIQNITIREQLLNYPHVGAAFEAFVSEEVIKGIQATEIVNWNYYYFRTRNGAEIDLIVEGPFGTLPIEIKFGTTIKQRQIQTLKNFVYKNNLPLGIVINNSDDIRLIGDRILQLPAACI